MGLFTSPVTLNNGAAHIYSFKGQLPDPKSMIGQYVEAAAAAALKQIILVKQDERSATVVRRLLSFKCEKTIADGITYKPITVNLTAIYHPQHTSTQVSDQIKLVPAACGATDFYTNFLLGYV